MRDTLVRGLPQLDVDLDAVPTLVQFAEMVLVRNRVMNLTAITEPKEVAALHLLDSLALLPLAGLTSERLVDVGCGAGFPGVPLAIAGPELHVTLLDSQKKRVDFLQESCHKLNLGNTRCVHGRAEEFVQVERESFDVAVSRAVAALPALCELCLPLVRLGGRMLAMKSSHSEEEISGAANAVKVLGGRLAWIKDYTIPGTAVTHRIVCVEKIAACPKKYPRRFALIKKQPL